MSKFPRISTHLPSSEHESFTTQNKTLKDELHLHKTQQKISIFSKRKMTVPSKDTPPTILGVTHNTAFKIACLWENAWKGDGTSFIQNHSQIPFPSSTMLHPHTHPSFHPHFLSLCVLSAPYKGIVWNTFNFRFHRTFPSGTHKWALLQWVAFIKRPRVMVIFCLKHSPAQYLKELPTESSDWSVSLSKGRNRAGLAIWKSIITGLMPAPFTSADLVSASSVKSELGGPLLSIFQIHYAVWLNKTPLLRDLDLSEASLHKKTCLLNLCLLWLFPYFPSHPKPGQKS